MGKIDLPGISTFSTEMAGAKALLLSIQTPKARASAKFQFPCFPLVSYRIFDEFSQNRENYLFLYFWVRNRFFTICSPKSHFRWFGVPQALTLPFKLENTGSNFGGSFDGGWKTFGGSSIPENSGKIQQEMGEKLGAQF